MTEGANSPGPRREEARPASGWRSRRGAWRVTGGSLLGLVAVAIVGPRAWVIVAAIALTTAPRVARVARGAAQPVVERDFIAASEAMGVPRAEFDKEATALAPIEPEKFGAQTAPAKIYFQWAQHDMYISKKSADEYFNAVTGQNDEFPVSLAQGHTRAAPAVAIGGSGTFIAFAWQDESNAAPGIYGRRFPLPP